MTNIWLYLSSYFLPCFGTFRVPYDYSCTSLCMNETYTYSGCVHTLLCTCLLFYVCGGLHDLMFSLNRLVFNSAEVQMLFSKPRILSSLSETFMRRWNVPTCHLILVWNLWLKNLILCVSFIGIQTWHWAYMPWGNLVVGLKAFIIDRVDLT